MVYPINLFLGLSMWPSVFNSDYRFSVEFKSMHWDSHCKPSCFSFLCCFGFYVELIILLNTLNSWQRQPEASFIKACVEPVLTLCVRSVTKLVLCYPGAYKIALLVHGHALFMQITPSDCLMCQKRFPLKSPVACTLHCLLQTTYSMSKCLKKNFISDEVEWNKNVCLLHLWVVCLRN